MAMYGYSSMYGYAWLCMAMYSYIYICIAMYVWLFMYSYTCITIYECASNFLSHFFDEYKSLFIYPNCNLTSFIGILS